MKTGISGANLNTSKAYNRNHEQSVKDADYGVAADAPVKTLLYGEGQYRNRTETLRSFEFSFDESHFSVKGWCCG